MRIWLFILLLTTLPGVAAGHDAGQARVRFDAGGSGRVEMARIDALDLLGLAQGQVEDSALYEAIEAVFPTWIGLSADGSPCTVAPQLVEPVGLRGVGIDFEGSCGAGAIELDWRLARHPRLKLSAIGAVVGLDGVETPVNLSRAAPTVTFGEPAVMSSLGFLISGIEHILIGWDHLAFLLALMIGCSGLRRLLVVVTGFTVAHSITLLLGATGVVTLPSEPVEAAIAGSIAVAAGMGLWRWRTSTLDHPGRANSGGSNVVGLMIVCFAFGLVHGLGFAGLLTEMLPSGGRLVPLLAFNLGVELGQVAVVAVIFPLLTVLGRSRFARPAYFGLLSALCALGLTVSVLRLM